MLEFATLYQTTKETFRKSRMFVSCREYGLTCSMFCYMYIYSFHSIYHCLYILFSRSPDDDSFCLKNDLFFVEPARSMCLSLPRWPESLAQITSTMPTLSTRCSPPQGKQFCHTIEMSTNTWQILKCTHPPKYKQIQHTGIYTHINILF